MKQKVEAVWERGSTLDNKASGSRDLKQMEGSTMQISEEEQTR